MFRRTIAAALPRLWLCLALPLLLGVAAAPSVFPPGILASGSSGVYAALNADGCCWLARRATLVVPAPARSYDTLLLTVEIPPYALASEPTAFDVRVAGAPPTHLCCFDAGQHELAVHLAHTPRKTRTLRVSIHPTTFFVPAERGLNSDTRELSVLLQRVELENSATGAQYLAGKAVAANGLGLNQVRLRVALIAIAFFAAVLLVRLRSAYGWALLLATAPFSLSVAAHGTTITLAKAVFIACTLAAIPLLREMRARGAFAPNAAIAAFLAFGLASTASALGAAIHHDAIRETLKIAEYLAIFLLAGAYYTLAPDERLLRRTLAWSTIIVAALAHESGEFFAIENPRFFARMKTALESAQQHLARKAKRSKNRAKARRIVSAIHRKNANKRRDFLHQHAAKLVASTDLIATESLSIKNMTRSAKGTVESPGHNVAQKAGLNREILATAPRAFLDMLAYKAEEAGIAYIEVPSRKVKPSQTCSGCGKQRKKALSERQHVCSCGLVLSRDRNGARVNLLWALAHTGREPTGCLAQSA